MQRPEILVNSSKKSFAIIARNIAGLLSRALIILGHGESALELHIVSNAEMRAINMKTRDKNEPTNVLSFEADGFARPDVGSRKYLGEIYLAPGVIASRGEDIQFLAIHGLLHLFQYTHKHNRDRITMERAEDRLLAKLAKGL